MLQKPIILHASSPGMLDQAFKILTELQSRCLKTISFSMFSLLSNGRAEEQSNLSNLAVDSAI